MSSVFEMLADHRGTNQACSVSLSACFDIIELDVAVPTHSIEPWQICR